MIDVSTNVNVFARDIIVDVLCDVERYTSGGTYSEVVAYLTGLHSAIAPRTPSRERWRTFEAYIKVKYNNKRQPQLTSGGTWNRFQEFCTDKPMVSLRDEYLNYLSMQRDLVAEKFADVNS